MIIGWIAYTDEDEKNFIREFWDEVDGVGPICDDSTPRRQGLGAGNPRAQFSLVGTQGKTAIAVKLATICGKRHSTVR